MACCIVFRVFYNDFQDNYISAPLLKTRPLPNSHPIKFKKIL